MVFKKAIEGVALRGRRRLGLGRNVHAVRNYRCAGPDEFSVEVDHARVARLNRAELRVIAHLRHLNAGAVDDVDETFAGFYLNDRAVDRYGAHNLSPRRTG